tara:strand:+ start:3573 stop:4247 length:675 start_codon:yes stop_codon:yes gene_type:complete
MISFIVPCHNYGYNLERCVKSILSNDKSLIKEILIINDSSTDNTKQVAFKLMKLSKKIFYFEKKFKNLSKTMNFGISKLRSNSIISKIDADDYIKKNYAHFLLRFFNFNNLDFLYSNLIIKEVSNNKFFYKNQKIKKIFKFFKYPNGSGCLIKKSLWKKVGGFNEKNFYQDDYDFWLKINKLQDVKIGYIDKSLYVYNKHNKNMSKNLIKKNVTKIKIFLKNLI